MSPTVYLVTGAGRGIGYTLVEQLSARANTVIYAGVRSLPLAADSELQKLANKLPEVVFPIKITSADEADNAAAVKEVASKAGKVDVIIANAGVSSGLSPISQITPEQLLADFKVNSIGPVVLFKAFAEPLLAAGGSGKFVVISSLLGMITDALPYPYNAYAVSKAAVNLLVKKIDMEYPQITAFPIHPGLVDTDMGREGAKAFGTTPEAMGAISPAQSAAGILAVVDKATKETHGGKFWDEKGAQLTY